MLYVFGVKTPYLAQGVKGSTRGAVVHNAWFTYAPWRGFDSGHPTPMTPAISGRLLPHLGEDRRGQIHAEKQHRMDEEAVAEAEAKSALVHRRQRDVYQSFRNDPADEVVLGQQLGGKQGRLPNENWRCSMKGLLAARSERSRSMGELTTKVGLSLLG